MKTLLIFILVLNAIVCAGADIGSYIKALKTQGQDPIPFTLAKLDTFDLLIFDDALHNAAEPFDFYQALIKHSGFAEKAKYIFIEAISIDQQRYIDRYLSTFPEDTLILLPVFQNDYSGTGWNAQTYLDLLRAVYLINSNLSHENRLEVVAVSNPFYWDCIRSMEDLEVARRSLDGRDYYMYRIIIDRLQNFGAGRKGIFLTNTRHAYKGIKNNSGQFYWNTGTFFSQWHPGRTYSIRMHNVNLYITAEVPPDSIAHKTTDGMERMKYSWVRMENGIWDGAFKAVGNKPVAIPLPETPFGGAAYIGNHMLGAAPGQTMHDAYDAVIFLAPIEALHKTGTFDFIYTGTFNKELERRYRILFTTEQIEAELTEAKVNSLQELFRKKFRRQPRMIHPLSKMIPPLE